MQSYIIEAGFPKLTIGLDYDGCITEDPEVWINFCRLFRERGHRIYIVTMRYPTEQTHLLQTFLPFVESIIYTSRRAKRPFVNNVVGIKIDIWIDDNPLAVEYDASVVFPTVTPLTVVTAEVEKSSEDTNVNSEI